MSGNVDERIIDMQFNNKQFESGVKESTKSVENLKKGLNLDGAARSLENLDRAGKSFSIAGIASGVDSIASRFTNMGIVGMGVLMNLGMAAANAGMNIAKSLTIEPVFSGFEEYETKMGAIQTILTNTKSKGTNLEDVNKALEELNIYADKTIYNFAEMTRNIGTFTAAGVDLKTSTESIKGIANLAAGSGSNALQASTAMYQLSQAMASGTVKLMDWNSVVNAGMGGELFQKALEKTAKELGHGRNMAVSFRESLESGWITAEVLTKTLTKFANDPDLLKAATEVKTITQMFSTMKESVQSGWAVSWENIIGGKEQSAKLLTNINDAFGALITPATEARNEMLKFWNVNGGRDAIIEGLSNAFKGLMSILKPVHEAFRDVFPAMTGERLVELSKSFRDFTQNLKIGEDTANKIKLTFKGLFSILSIGLQIIGTLARGVGILFGVVMPVGGGLLELTSAFGGFLVNLNASIKASGIFTWMIEKLRNTIAPIPNIFKEFEALTPVFDNFANGFEKAFGTIGEYMSKIFGNFSFEKLFQVINGALGAGVLIGITRLIKSFKDITDNAGGLLSGITDVLDGVKDSLQAYQTQLQAGTLLRIAVAIGILAGALAVLSLIDPDKLSTALAGISILFLELFGALAAFTKIVAGAGFKGFISVTLLSFALMGISFAVLILADALVKLSRIKWNELGVGLAGVTGIFVVLIAASKKMEFSSPGMVTGALGLIGFAGALLILSNAVEKLSKLSIKSLAKGLGSIGVIFTELTVFLRLNLFKLGIPAAIGLLVFASALNLLTNSVSRLGNMDYEVLLKGLLGLGEILMQVAAFSILMNRKQLLNASISFAIIAISLNAMATAIRSLGELPYETIFKGLLTMAEVLLEIVAFSLLMEPCIKGAASLLIISGAILVLSFALKKLGSLSLKQMAKSLTTLAAAFVVIGLAGKFLAPVIPAILGLAGSILGISVSIVLLGAGLLLVGAGISAIAVGLTALAGALVFVMKALVEVVDEIGIFLTAILQVLIDVTPLFARTMITIMDEMLKALIDFTPRFTAGMITLILAMLKGVTDGLPRIVDAAVILLVAFVNTIITNLPKVIQAGFDLVIGFINGVADALRGNSDTLVKAMDNLIQAVGEAGMKALRSFIPSFGKVGVDLVSGLIGGMGSMIGDLCAGAANMARRALQSAKDALGIKSPSKEFENLGIQVNQGLASGLVKYAGMSEGAASGIGETINQALMKAIIEGAGIDEGLNPTITPVLDLTNVNSGLQDAFAQQQRLNVTGIQSQTDGLSNINQTKNDMIFNGMLDRLSGLVEKVVSGESQGPVYNIEVNNPEPEVASDSIRDQLMRVNYLGGFA